MATKVTFCGILLLAVASRGGAAHELNQPPCHKGAAEDLDDSICTDTLHLLQHDKRIVRTLAQPSSSKASDDPEFEANPYAQELNVSDLEALDGDHRYILVRPCARTLGDGLSGLTRRLPTGECCGDGACAEHLWESNDNCPQDCPSADAEVDEFTKVMETTESTLFGTLEGLQHEEYHCQDDYVNSTGELCSPYPDRASEWLEDLLNRSAAGTLPFSLPPRGAVAVEFGAGLGQDSRNMANLAGYAVTAVDVSPDAIDMAKVYTPSEQKGFGPGQIEFVAYDAFALPAPQQPVDFIFDATVYCGLRHEYLSRAYDVWRRLATPKKTLIFIQCWQVESASGKVAKTKHDMETDFEPVFEVLHSETCAKNQGGKGHCFALHLRDLDEQAELFTKRLELQRAARDGDLEFVRAQSELSRSEGSTLIQIANLHGHEELVKYLLSVFPEAEAPSSAEGEVSSLTFTEFKTVYGEDAFQAVVDAEDQKDARLWADQLKLIRSRWEQAELAKHAKLEEMGSASYLEDAA